MNGNGTIELSDTARTLHTDMIRGNKLYTQPEVQKILPNLQLNDLMLIVQELLDKNLIKLIKQNNELKFQAVDASEAAKKSSMSSEEALVYSYIEASGREGIWSKTIKARTNLHQHVVLKCLKSLESQRYVKSVKSVKFPTRKIYMLYALQPSVEVTGGPWFTEGELDVEFINSLLTIVWRFITENTFPNGFQTSNGSGSGDGGKMMAQYGPGVKNYCLIQEILDFITGSQVANVDLSTANIRALCEVLVYDDKLEQVAPDCYRTTLQSLVQLGNHQEIDTSRAQSNGDEDLSNGIDEFSIFDFYSSVGPSQHDKDAVYFDEWAL